jgi:hypothetical protein
MSRKERDQRIRDIKYKKNFWKIPKIYDAGTVFILGGGPSINTTNFDLIKDKPVIGVNDAYLLGEWVDICWFGDCRWYYWHKDRLKQYSGLVATHCGQLLGKDPRVKVCTRGKPAGIENKAHCVSWNRNSGASAINFAYQLGAKSLVLLGYDMRRVNEKPNWHDNHPSPHKNPYTGFLRVFPIIAKDAKALKMEIVNCTPGSKMDCFPIYELEDYLNGGRTDLRDFSEPSKEPKPNKRRKDRLSKRKA